jgi:hypothetical protein
MRPSAARAARSIALSVLLVVPIVAVGPFVTPASATTTAFGTGECAQQVSAAGSLVGAVAVDGTDCLVAFRSGSGEWSVPAAVTGIHYLVVGGGGGGGSRGGGGAGALFETATAATVTPGDTISVAIGVGGAAGTATTAGANGTPSVFDGVSAYGGGGGTSTRQYDRDPVRNLLPSPPEGTDLAARPVFTASFTDGQGGSGGGGQASPVHDWIVSTDGSDITQVTTLGSDDRGGLGRPAGSAGTGLRRSKGGDSQSIFHRFSDGKLRSFWIGGGGGGAGAAGADVAWASDGETVEDVIASNGDVVTVDGPGFVPGAGGAGVASTLLSPALAVTLAVGHVADGAVHFAGGGAGRANYDSVNLNLALLTRKDLIGAGGLGGGGGSSGAAGRANTGGGGAGTAAGGSGVVLVRYTRAEQAPLALDPSGLTIDEPVTLVPSGGSGTGDLSVVSVAAEDPCTLSGTTLTATAASGTCTVTVTRAADVSYVARTDTFELLIGDPPIEDPEDPEDPGDGPGDGSGPGLALRCAPEPVVAGGTVTCSVSGADPDIDIVWVAATDGTAFAGGTVRTSTDGTATLSFVVPRGAAGAPLSVELVAWAAPKPIGVALTPVPSSVRAGEGSPTGPLPLPPSSGIAALAAAGLVLWWPVRRAARQPFG